MDVDMLYVDVFDPNFSQIFSNKKIITYTTKPLVASDTSFGKAV